MLSLRKVAIRILCAALLASTLLAIGASTAKAAPTFTALTLKNGWVNAPYATRNAAVANISGIVHFKGAIATAGTNAVPFTLPLALRPATDVYVPIDLCDAKTGRLWIQPSGVVAVQAVDFAAAQCFTSLEGASFAKGSTGFTALPLINGWTNAPFRTSNAAAKLIAGVVHLKGAIATSGTDMTPFVLPPELRPAAETSIPVNLCQARTGRLWIFADGSVAVHTLPTESSFARCFTSLDGVSFLRAFAPKLALKNGWKRYSDLTAPPGAKNINGIVTFKGLIAAPVGTTGSPFTLPIALRPATDVYIPVNVCPAATGRLWIKPSGVVTIQAPPPGDPQCATSLDGAAFAL